MANDPIDKLNKIAKLNQAVNQSVDPTAGQKPAPTKQSKIAKLEAYANAGIPNVDTYNYDYEEDEGLLPGMNQDAHRANNQSAWEMWRNSGRQTIAEISTGMGKSVGYLLDLEAWGDLIMGGERDFSNKFVELMDEMNEDVKMRAPVFKTEDAQSGWAPGDSTWWASNFPSIGSALSFMVPTRAAVGILGKVGKSMGAGSKFLTSKTGQTIAKGISGAVVSRYTESMLEANESAKRAYNEAIRSGKTIEEAEAIRADAGATSWKANMAMIGPDLFQYTTLAGGFKGMNQALKLAFGMAGESVEEGYQHIVGEEAVGSALGRIDFFGKDFGTRLSDYVDDPNFKTAATFGALGGGLFQGAEIALNWNERKQDKLIDQKLSALRQAKIGNLDGVKKLKDLTFAQLAYEHVLTGKGDQLKDELDMLSQEADLDPEVRSTLKKYGENVEYMEKQYDLLRGNKEVDQELVPAMLLNKLDIKTTSEDLTRFQAEAQKSIQEVLGRKEFASELTRAKELWHTKKAYENLQTKSKKDFSEAIKLFDDIFWQQVADPGILGGNKRTDGIFQLINTSEDPQIQDKFDKIVATQERLNAIKSDLNASTTSAGQAQMKAEKAVKNEAAVVDALLRDTKTTLAQLEAAAAKTTQPELKAKLEAAIAKTKQAKQSVNKGKTEVQADKEKTKQPKKKQPKNPSFEPDPTDVDDSLPIPDDRLQDDINEIWGEPQEMDYIPEVQQADIPEGYGAEAGVATLDDQGNLVIKRLETESITQPSNQEPIVEEQKVEQELPLVSISTGTVKTVLKEIAGDWKMIRVQGLNGQVTEEEAFVPQLNADTTPKIQDYYFSEDATTKQNPIPVYEVFKSSNNILAVNTPNVAPGMSVIIKKEPQWPFWKSNKPENVVWNVYEVIDGKPQGKPLTQIPASSNPKTSTPETRAFRDALNKSGKDQVFGRIAHKNNGDLLRLRNDDGSRIENNLSVLEYDMAQTGEGWNVQKTLHNPILAYIDPSQIVQVPNAETMRGMLPQNLQRIAEMDTLSKGAPGTLLTLRTNPSGGYSIAHLEPRKINEDEYSWLMSNIAEYLADKRYSDLKTLINIEQAGIEENINKYRSASNPKLVIIAGDVAFEVRSGKTPYWVKINATGEYGQNFLSFIQGNPFSFQVYNADGTKRPGLQSSDSVSSQIRTDIQSSFESLLRGSFKNIDRNFLNTEGTFVDVTGKEYRNYYTYLKETNSVTTDLPEGYSFFNSTIYLDPQISTTRTVVEPVTKEIIQPPRPTVEQKVVPPAPPTPEKPSGKKKNIDWDKLADEDTDTRYRLVSASTGTFKVISQKELNWMQDKFGPEYLTIAQGVDRVISEYGLEAFGYYHNAHITLAQLAEEGSGYHEAFHFVTLTQLNNSQYEKLIKDAASIFGKDKNRVELEELLAEDFRAYMLSDGQYTPRVAASRNLFQRILDYIRKALGFKTSIERMFENIANYDNKSIPIPRELEFGDLRHRLIPGFQRVNQQTEALTAGTYRLLEKAMELAEKESVGFDDILELPDNVGKLLNEILAEYKKARVEIEKTKVLIEDGSLELSMVELRELAQKDRTLKAIVENWEDVTEGENTLPGYQTTLIQNLGKYGFTIKIKNIQPTGVEEDEDTVPRTEGDEVLPDDPNTKERIHDVSFLLSSPLKTLSSKIKRFLATIPEYRRDSNGIVLRNENGEPLIATTIFGTPRYVDFNRVYSNLSSKLAGYKNTYTRLTELAQTDAIFAAVKDELDRHIKDGQVNMNPVPAQFFTAFNKSKYKFFTTLVGFEKGQPIARVIETDRRNIERTLISDWEMNAIRKDTISTDGTPNLKKIQGLMDQLQTSKKKGKSGTYEDNKNTFQSILAELGIDLPAQVWKKLEQSRKKSSDLADLMYGQEKATLEQFLTTALSKVNPFEETGFVTELANQAKDYVDDLQAKTFINEKGNQVSAINLNTYITDLIASLTSPQSGKAKIDWFMQDGFYKTNQFLTLLQDSKVAKGINVNVFSAFRDGTTAQPKEFSETTVQDSFISRLTAYYSNGNKNGYIYLGTLSDKSQQLSINLPKKQSNAALPFLKDVLRGTVASEIVRIQRLRAGLTGTGKDEAFSPNQIASYKNAASFKYIPALNQIPGLADSLADGTLDPDNLGAMETQINAVIDQFIAQEEKAYLDKLEELALIAKNPDPRKDDYVNLGLPEALGRAGSINRLLKEFFYNDLAWRLEMSKVFHGDMAFYKNAETYFKRGYQLITPGLQGYYNPDLKSAGKKEFYTRGIFASSIKSNLPNYLAELGSLITPGTTVDDILAVLDGRPARTRGAQIAAQYASVNKTDAQSYCRIGTYRDIALSVGQWTDDHELLYNIAWRQGKSVYQAVTFSKFSPEQKQHLMEAEAKLLLQPLKPFTFADREVRLSDGSTMILKEQFKESITPLLPVWANKHTQFKELLAAMERDNVDIVSDSEAVKVGSYGVNTDLSQPIITRQIPASAMRFPFFIPEKAKHEILAGTQIEKLIVGNIDSKTTYKVGKETMRGDVLVQEYHKTWSDIIKGDYEEFKKLFKLEDNLRVPDSRKLQFLKDLKSVLLEELSHRDLPDNYYDSLLIIKNKLDQPTFMVGLDFPALGKKYEQILTGLFKKRLMTQKLPGDSLINLADYGVSKSDVSSELKFIQNNNGEIVEAEVGVPYRFVKGLGLKLGEVTDPSTGKVLWDKLTPAQQEAMQLIIYRIPTQGKNSMIPCRIATILPDSAGSVILIPGEMTKQGGMDFDVDKSYVMKRETKKVVTEEGKSTGAKVVSDTLANKLFNIHWAVLTNKAHAEELLNPLDSIVHDQMIAYLEGLGVVSRNVKNSPFNVATDLEQEKLAKYSKAMIGIFSKFSVGHATMQTVPDQVQIKTPIAIVHPSGYRYNQIGKMRDDSGIMISDNHSAQQNSALDAQKDPKLGYLNITTFNANALAYMTDLGVNQKLALTFMNQPILRELSDEYFKNGDGSLPNAVRNLTQKYVGLETMLTDLKKNRDIEITPSLLEKALVVPTGEQMDTQAQVLADFIEYFYASQDMAKVNTALSTDTVRDFTSIAAVQAFGDIVTYVTSRGSKVELSPDVFIPTKSRIKRVAAFYNYAVRAALQFTKQFYPYNSEAYTAVRSEIAKATLQRNDKLRDKDDIVEIDHAMTYYILGENQQLEKTLSKFSPKFSDRFSYFQPSHSMALYVERMKKKFPRLDNNLLIQALKQDTYIKKEGVQMLGINNTHGNFNKTNLTNAWWDLMTDPDEQVKTLAYDLVRYAIQTSGFKTTPSSFIDLVPAEFWRDSGLAEYHASLTEAYSEGAKSVSVPDATKVVIRHIYNSTNIVKSIPFKKDRDGNISSAVSAIQLKEKDGTHVVEFMGTNTSGLFDENSERQWAQFARMYDRSARRWRLYERQPETLIYQEIQGLGERNSYVEFTTNGNAFSKHPANEGRTTFRYEVGKYPGGSPIGDSSYIDNQMYQAYNELNLTNGPITATELLPNLIKLETDLKRKEILERMLKNADKLANVSINVGETGESWGVFNMENLTITISPFINREAALHHIIIHELVHAYSVEAINNPKTEVERNFSDTIRKLWKEARPNFSKEEYGTQNPFEFIAELASNKDFRDTVRVKKTLWQRILSAFRRLLGLTDSYDTIFDQFYKVMDEAYTFEPGPGGRYFYKGKQASKSSVEIDKLFSRLVSSLEKRVNRLKRQKKDAGNLEKLTQDLLKVDNKVGLIRYVASTIREIDQLTKDIKDTLAKPDKMAAKDLRIYREQINSYKILRDIRNHIYLHPEEYKDVKPLSKDKTLVQVIDTMLGHVQSADIDIRNASIDVVANWVKNNTSQNLELDDIKQQLNVADRDITLINRGLDAIVNSRDAVLRTIGKEVINAKARAYRKTEDLLKSKWLDINEKYEKWLKSQGVNPRDLRERHKFIIDDKSMQKGSNAIFFVDPDSKAGQAIKKRPKGDPLKEYYEMVVEGYLKSQKSIPMHMRPGLRVPSIRRSTWELFTEEQGIAKLGVLKQGLIDTFRRNYDEVDFQSTDEAGNPIDFLPIRYISKQDGTDGRMSIREVSLDFASTVLMFIDEMNSHDELYKIVHDLELAKDVLASREVTDTRAAGLLSADRIAVTDPEGFIQTKRGSDSHAYKQAEQFISRMVYGKVKEVGKNVKLGPIEVNTSKAVDALLRYTGIRMMAGNLNVVFSNIATGEATILKEAIGGRWFNLSDWKYGKKTFAKEAIPYLGEMGQRKKLSKFGAIYELFNPSDDHRGNMSLGKDNTVARRILDTKNLNFLNDATTLEMNGSLMLSIMNQFKLQGPNGEEANLYDALTVEDGVVKVKKGYTYGGKDMTQEDLNKVRNKIIAIHQKVNGIYNTIDSSGIKAYAWGRLVLMMRNWLKPGIDARWKLQYYDERLQGTDEGYYISALRFFQNTFGPDGWFTKDVTNLRYLVGLGLDTHDFLSPQEREDLNEEQKKDLTDLRRSNLKKAIFEAYLIASLTALAMFGWDEDEKDSFVLYHIVRLKRELSTFFSPTEAWSTLRSPTVALDTIQRLGQFVSFVVSPEGYEEYKQGPNKGEVKAWAAIQNKIPLWAQRNQFNDLDRKIDLIERGWK